ncbi:MAG TPA: hypothetical protein VEB39_06690 [Sphingomicrobium sp.]|nr:hypothetical protein [Sphingomicrobium sp.]
MIDPADGGGDLRRERRTEQVANLPAVLIRMRMRCEDSSTDATDLKVEVRYLKRPRSKPSQAAVSSDGRGAKYMDEEGFAKFEAALRTLDQLRVRKPLTDALGDVLAVGGRNDRCVHHRHIAAN